MEKALGVYIHIPFCASKCAYCDFYSLAGQDRLMPRYHDALLTHIREASPQLQNYNIDTVFFGGGTPSFYGADHICELFNALKRSGRVYRTAEVTMEANPDSLDRSDLRRLRSEGINRISIGAQCADDRLLKLIGRRHNWQQVIDAVVNAQKTGFRSINIDLIYGLPGQSAESWAQTLDRAIALNPTHISCYGLQLEEGTPLYENYKGSPFLPDDDAQADMYLYAVNRLAGRGFHQYEISNFAQKGFECRHNMKYWRLRDYMSFGPGAHSCIGNVRYSYRKDLQGYIRGIREHEDIIDEYEEVAPFARASEYLMLGLRTSKGICAREYSAIYRSDFTPIEKLMEEFEMRGFARKRGDYWRFTPNGFLLSNTLLVSVLEQQAKLRMEATPWIDSSDLYGDSPEIPLGDKAFMREGN